MRPGWEPHLWGPSTRGAAARCFGGVPQRPTGRSSAGSEWGYGVGTRAGTPTRCLGGVWGPSLWNARYPCGVCSRAAGLSPTRCLGGVWGDAGCSASGVFRSCCHTPPPEPSRDPLGELAWCRGAGCEA